MEPAGPDLTLLVPCFDEGPRLAACVAALDAWGRAHPETRAEIVLVDDGSTDEAFARLATQAPRDPEAPPLRVVALPVNRGKGAALRAGMRAARGSAIVFLDADLAVGPASIANALAALAAGADLAVGCRNVPGADILRRQGLLRRTLGRAYLRLCRRLLGLRTPDVTCGFKAFCRAAGQDLFRRSRCRRWGVDAEVLALAERAGLVVEPLPVRWRDGGRSAVRLVRDVLGAARELLAVRWRLWWGAYGGAPAVSAAHLPLAAEADPAPSLHVE